MLSVPLSMTGALATLWLAGGTLNIYSQVGLVTLVGLITKHGILIVEFSNQLRAKGEKLIPAVIDAATLRLRPILMTTGAMVLGALPLALATGAGGESRTQIGWVIVGGLTFGTLLTLYVVPTAYTLLAGPCARRCARHGCAAGGVHPSVAGATPIRNSAPGPAPDEPPPVSRSLNPATDIELQSDRGKLPNPIRRIPMSHSTSGSRAPSLPPPCSASPHPRTR